MENIASIFNHLVLPVKLPDQRDPEPEAISAAILDRLLNACQAMDKDSSHVWSSTIRCLRRCKGIARTHFDAQDLMQDWSDFRLGDVLLLRVSEQNAALLIRREVL